MFGRFHRIRVLTLLAPVVLWQVVVSAGLISENIIPPPLVIGSQTLEMLTDAGFLDHLLATLGRTALAGGLASLFGIPIGFAMSANERLRAVLSPVISAIFALPVIAMFPLLILVLGETEAALIFTAGIGSFTLLVWNAKNGANAIDPAYLDLARHNGATSRLAMLREVWLPGALPLIFVGLRLGLSMSLLIVTAVEFVAGDSGLGYLLWISWQSATLPQLYATLVVIGVVGITITDGLAMLRGHLIPWDEPDNRTFIGP